ncbi:MAG: FAD-dependent oxidoreductase, partial [Bacteroidota bacterium]
GTLEISGLSKKIDQQRIRGILESVPKYYKNLTVPFDQETPIWQGYRPCTPDGMPYIGPSQSFSNLFVGTGHGMMGLSLGAITGKLLCEIITNEKPLIPIEPFRLERF